MTSETRLPEMEGQAFAEELRLTPLDNRSPLTATFPGLDASSYPGDHAMAIYKGLGFSVTGAYLTHAPGRLGSGHVDNGWIAAVSSLERAGWGIAPIYVGAEPAGSSHVPPPTDPLGNAKTDAKEAIALAQQAQIGQGRTIYLDVEAAFQLGTAYESYVLKWAELTRAAGYKPAIYCFPRQITWANNNGLDIWTVHLNSHTGTKDKTTNKITWSYLTSPLPSDSVDVGAIGTQGRFYCRAGDLLGELDYDCWFVKDPSSV